MPILGIKQGWGTGPWLPAQQVCRDVMVWRGEKFGMYTQAMPRCSTLKPESSPQHILFHCINGAKEFQQKERNLHSENDQWMGVVEGLTQRQCLQQLCSETAGHGAGGARREQKD